MLICPICNSKNIKQFRTPTGAIWCENCGLQALHKEVDNPFISEQTQKQIKSFNQLVLEHRKRLGIGE